MINRILSAPSWLVIPAALAIGAAVVLAVTSRGRKVLRVIGKAVRRPVAALLLAALGAGLCGLMTTIAVTCIFARPPYVNFKGVVVVFFFGFLIGLPAWLPVILIWSLPVYALVWLPLWVARWRFRSFWRWLVAPVTGGVLTYLSWIILEAIYPLFGEDYQHRELITAAHVAAFADGVFMFALGCSGMARKDCAPPSTPVVVTPVGIESDETRAV